MFPKQLYQAQLVYNRYKDNFRDIKVLISDDIASEFQCSNIDSIFTDLIITDIEYIFQKFQVVIHEEATQPEFFYILGFISNLKNANFLFGGLQGNDIETKIKIINYIDSAEDLGLPVGFILQSLKSKPQNHLIVSYNEFLLQFAQGIASADKNLSINEIKIITEINTLINSNAFGEIEKFQINTNSAKSSSEKDIYISTDSIINEAGADDVLEELESFTGMEGIKRDVRTLINLLKIQKQREKQGLSVVKPSLHMVFTGPPGTGKTTVARILGKIFKALGILNNGHLVETDRSGLVAGYIGQTAIKVDEVIEKSIGGILFIDEAYTLSPSDGQDSYGQEAIDTLLKRMEDYRDSLIVIAAGYEEEMQRFIESNPGLKSRFNKYISFVDYKPDELIEIFLTIVKKNNYIASDELVNLLRVRFDDLYNLRTKSFGNGRMVRNIFEKIVENQSNRLAQIKGKLSKADLQLLLPEDCPN